MEENKTRERLCFNSLELKSRYQPNGLRVKLETPLTLEANFDERLLQVLDEITAGALRR